MIEDATEAVMLFYTGLLSSGLDNQAGRGNDR